MAAEKTKMAMATEKAARGDVSGDGGGYLTAATKTVAGGAVGGGTGYGFGVGGELGCGGWVVN